MIASSESTLPVPEALDRARLPLRPALAHHLLCSIAGLGFVAANIVADAKQSDMDTLGMLTGISTGLLVWLAWRFAGRRVSQRRFNTWAAVVWSTLTLFCVAQFIRYFEVKGFLPADHSGGNFLGSGAVRCRPLAIRPRVLVSGHVAAAPRAQKTAHPIAQLVDTSTIFPLRRRLDVAFRYDQIGQFRDGIAEDFNRNH